MTGFTLFGVVGAGHPLAGAREAVPTVTVLEHGDLAVVVAPVEPGYTVGDDDAVEHLDVLGRLVLDGPVLPFALGTVAPSADAIVQEVLVDRAAELNHRLELLADVVEVRVDLVFDPQDGVRAAAAAEPALLSLAERARGRTTSFDEQLRLGEEVLAAVGRWWDDRAATLVSPIVAIAERSATLPPPDEHRRRWAFLVRRDRWQLLEDTLRAVQDEAVAEGIQIAALGPIPAYSFLEHLDDSAATGDTAPGPAIDADPVWSGSARWGW